MADDISGVAGPVDWSYQPVVECPHCEDGKAWNSPLASRRGDCLTCNGEGWVGAAPKGWDGGWS